MGECVPSRPGGSPEASTPAATVPRLVRANSSSDEETSRPSPVRCRSTQAASSPSAQLSPAPTSSTGAPTLTGPDEGAPVTLIMPLSACRMRSNPPLDASGPTSPYPEMDP